MKKAILSGVIAAIGTIVATLITIYLSNTRVPSNTGMKIIAGTVVEQGSSKPIGQAQIDIVGRNESDLSQDNGNFRLIIHGDGIITVQLRISKRYYKTVDFSFPLPDNRVIIQMIYEKGMK